MSAAGLTSTGLGYRIPSLGWRILAGALRLIPMVLLLVGLPGALLAFLLAHGIAAPLSILTVTIFGILICAFATARYIGKPTRLYGPLAVATAVVTLLYLRVILAASTYTFSLPNSDFTLTFSYLELIELLLVVPTLAVAAGIVTTIEDLRAERERLPFDFPP